MIYREKSDLVQLLSINNLIPIMVTFVTAIVFTINLSGRIDLVNQKLDLLIAEQQQTLKAMQAKDSDLEIKYAQMQKQWGELSQRVTRLER